MAWPNELNFVTFFGICVTRSCSFAPSGLEIFLLSYLRLTPWAAFLLRFAACLSAGADLDSCTFGESGVEKFDDSVAHDAFEFLVGSDDGRRWRGLR